MGYSMIVILMINLFINIGLILYYILKDLYATLKEKYAAWKAKRLQNKKVKINAGAVPKGEEPANPVAMPEERKTDMIASL